MQGDYDASDMVVGVGNMIENAMNLKGEPIGPRNTTGPTTVGAHYGNADGEFCDDYRTLLSNSIRCLTSCSLGNHSRRQLRGDW